MSRRLAHGCSFTHYKWSCWPKYVEWFVDSKVENKGETGSANETIARKVIESVHEDRPEHVYIMWSGAGRYEVWDDKGDIKTGGHPDYDKHRFYIKNFLNNEQAMYKTLEKIFLVQMFLKKQDIPYTMMLWKGDIITENHVLYHYIDWTKFVFYKDRKGLWEFAEENFKEYYLQGEAHPPPIAHYHWVKDIMFKSDVKCPEDEYEKLKNYFKGSDGRS